MKRILAATLALSLTGCATTLDPNYALQLESYRQTVMMQQQVEVAKARAEEARYNAMATIAERADPQSKQMALLALALGGRGEVSTRPVEVALPSIPKTNEDRALQWAAIFAGPTTAIATGYFGYRLGQTQSNNQSATTQASYAAILGMKPAPVDFTKIPPTTDSHNIITTTTTTNTPTSVRNDDGNVLVGTGDIDNNRPIAVIPPVTVIQPAPIVPVVVTNP